MMFEKVKESTAKETTATVLFTILLIKISFVNGIGDSAINLLNSIARNEAEPTNVFIKSCWPLNAKIDFMKRATVQVFFIDDFLYKLPVDLSPNYVMFITDLDCEWANDFVNGVRNFVSIF